MQLVNTSYNHLVSSTDLAWAAGLIDGEGNIGLHKAYHKKMKNQLYAIELSVHMTSKVAVDRLFKMFGLGHINFESRLYTNHKDIYRWKCVSNQACRVIRQIYPYLVVKKEQAKYVLEYLDRKTDCYADNLGLQQAELEHREFFWRLLRGLNRRGRP